MSNLGVASGRISLCFVIAAALQAGGCGHRGEDAAAGRSQPDRAVPARGEEAKVPQATEEVAGVQPVVSSVATPEELLASRRQLDATILAPETEAQLHEQRFVRLWDSLLRSDRPYEVFRSFPFDRLVVGTLGSPQDSDWGVPGIQSRRSGAPTHVLDRLEFQAMLDQFAAEGWRVDQTEWHHSTYEPSDEGPPTSIVSFEIHVSNSTEPRRVIIRGKLGVRWSGLLDDQATPIPEELDATDVVVLEQAGDAMFTSTVIEPRAFDPQANPHVSPLIVYDLNGDGYSELLLVGCNQVYRNLGEWKFSSEKLLAHGTDRLAEAAIVADFTGDGFVDLLCAAADEMKLRLYAGDAEGRFSQPSTICFPTRLQNPHVVTAGDVDGDGDLDVYVGQWRPPYDRGSMPIPYYDANDGFPDYLLLNNGAGRFSDATLHAGLGDKRARRTFSASFVDFDDDGDLDLLRVADFAGLDLYANDGTGRFEEVTDELVDERHAFGMSHALDDFDLDGELDLYMVGMSSTTARRLDQLGLVRDNDYENEAFRMKMGYGNRMYLRDGDRFSSPAWSDQVARTGWSWGCTATDFDNDGDSDLYVANGHISGNSVTDYCTRFWCHDIYDGVAEPNPVLDEFYKSYLIQSLGRDISWNGYEHNVLFLNGSGSEFLNAAYLLGAAFEFDARAVVSDDLDADGCRDLLVLQYDNEKGEQRLHILQNRLESPGAWIGVRLSGHEGGPSPLGAKVAAYANDRKWLRCVVAGDSFTAQHAAIVHFGLGDLDHVDRIEVSWPDGTRSQIDGPQVNQYHEVRAGSVDGELRPN